MVITIVFIVLIILAVLFFSYLIPIPSWILWVIFIIYLASYINKHYFGFGAEGDLKRWIKKKQDGLRKTFENSRDYSLSEFWTVSSKTRKWKGYISLVDFANKYCRLDKGFDLLGDEINELVKLGKIGENYLHLKEKYRHSWNKLREIRNDLYAYVSLQEDSYTESLMGDGSDRMYEHLHENYVRQEEIEKRLMKTINV